MPTGAMKQDSVPKNWLIPGQFPEKTLGFWHALRYGGRLE
jgi:hypothetical protein